MKKWSRNIVLFLFLTFIPKWGSHAQTINGKIISSQNSEPVPFANVVIKGTTIGIASDFEGIFEINIPEQFRDGILSISAVGFTPNNIEIKQLNGNKANTITLQVQEYNIDEVDVEAKSKVLYGAVKKCNKSIADNYITQPYSCDFTYQHNGKTTQGIITDNTGYQRTTFKGAFRKINYRFEHSEGKRVNKPFFAGRTNMEDLLSFDLVRTVGNVIDEEKVYDFDLSLVPQNYASNLWVIHFSCQKPQLHNTGDAHATAYEGELHVDKNNFAITKIVVRGQSSKRSIHGKSIVVGEKSSHYSSDLTYEVTSNYIKDNSGKYRLDEIKMKETFTDAKGARQTQTSALKIKQVKAEIVNIKGRNYYVRN